MTPQLPYDALVVGAGPGGATAATFMARAGLRVLLVDKDRFPRDKTCGDALSGKTVDVLRRLGIVDAVEAGPSLVAWGILFSSPYGSEVDVQFCDPATATTAPGYVMARTDFDALVVDAARTAGAEVWEETTVTGLVREGTRVTGATLKRGGETQTVHARVVVGADGAYSAVARALGFDQLDERHYCAGLRQYWEGVTGFHDHNLIELHFVDEAIPGYFWIFPMANGRANVGIGMLSSEIKKRDVRLKDVLKACIAHPRFADRFKDARPLEKIHGYGLPLGSRPRPLSGDGWMLVGDAASLIDPFSGEGIGNAMVSGEFAARHAVLALTGAPAGGDGAASTVMPGVASAARLSGYDRDVMAYLGGELRLSHIMQRLGRRKWLLHFVIDQAARKPAIKKALSTMFEDEQARAQLKSPLFYLRALLS